MNEEMKKSLTALIDETLMELEELKKSRFAAEEVKLEGPGDKDIAGKPSNGELEAKKADKEEDDEEESEEMAEKAEDEDDEEEMNKKEKNKGVNVEKKEEEKKEEEKKEDKPAVEKEMRKSDDEMESLMKSMLDERVKPLEDKLSVILDLVNKIADQPVAPKGVAANAVPLLKSSEERQLLSKHAVADKLFELKKSGTQVDSLDIARAEMGHDLEKIVDKYKIS